MCVPLYSPTREDTGVLVTDEFIRCRPADGFNDVFVSALELNEFRAHYMSDRVEMDKLMLKSSVSFGTNIVIAACPDGALCYNRRCNYVDYVLYFLLYFNFYRRFILIVSCSLNFYLKKLFYETPVSKLDAEQLDYGGSCI